MPQRAQRATEIKREKQKFKTADYADYRIIKIVNEMVGTPYPTKTNGEFYYGNESG